MHFWAASRLPEQVSSYTLVSKGRLMNPTPSTRWRWCLSALLAVAGTALAQQAPAPVPPADPARPLPSDRGSLDYNGMPPTSAGFSRSDSRSYLPYTQRGYIGMNLGRTQFDLPCGLGSISCDKNTNLSFGIYTGGMFNEWLGLEVGYLYTGKADRAGGSTSAQGVNALLVGRVPLGQFNVFAKAGGVYGRSRVTTNAESSFYSGAVWGGGAAYGAGIGYDFDRNNGVVLEWQRNKFKMPPDGHPDSDTTSIGYVYRF